MKDRIIPKVFTHDIQLITEGIGSSNSKEYCKCDDCSNLRLRRDNIYKSNSLIKFLSKIWIFK